MRLRAARIGAAFLILAQIAATAPATAYAAGTAFVDLPRLMANHPLHAVLGQYDEEIAALRSTQRVPGLHDPAATSQHEAASLQADADGAAARADSIGAQDPAGNRAREKAAIAQLLSSQRGANAKFAADTSELVSETNANLRAYGSSLSAGSQRAYAAREQQLREKELTLAYDLERNNAGRRLMLRLKLDDLRLNGARRANLRAQLAELNASELRSIGTMRSADARELAAYRTDLEHSAAASAQEMDRQLRTKAGANYTILQSVFYEAGSGLQTLPSASQFAGFAHSYAALQSGQDIAAGMQATGNDLSQRFRLVAAVDSQSQRDARGAIGRLQSDRDALYRQIVAQIRAVSLRIAREQGFQSVYLGNAAPNAGSADLTQQVAAQLARDW